MSDSLKRHAIVSCGLRAVRGCPIQMASSLSNCDVVSLFVHNAVVLQQFYIPDTTIQQFIVLSYHGNLGSM